MPPLALTDPESFIGETLIAPVLSGQIVALIPMQEHTNVVFMQETVEMPEDAQVGEFFDVYTQGEDSEAGIFVVSKARLTYMQNGGPILEIPLEHGPALQELASNKSPIRLIRSE